jgi:hypothetical protein
MKDGSTRLAYPTPAQHLYGLLRDFPVEELRRRFAGWRFTAGEAEALLRLRPLAHRHDLARFSERLRELLEASPGDYPPVLRPRLPTGDLAARRQEYAALLKGKRVALVGPSRSVVGSRQGRRLEDFDLVARINFQWPVPPERVADVGARMDILYHCCNGDVPIDRLFQPGFERTRFVCWQFGIDSQKLQDHCATVAVPELEVSSVFGELLATMNAFPTTGTVAVFDLLCHAVECLYVTGMTFFREPYYDGYPTGGRTPGHDDREVPADTVGIHDVPAQLDLVRRIQASDPRLRVDSTLGELLAGGA